MNFQIGQKYLSTTEPELGLGKIESVEHKKIQVFFASSQDLRTYNKQNAPLKRVKFDIGDSVKSLEGLEFEIQDIVEEEGIFIYKGTDSQVISESELSDQLTFSSPIDKCSQGHFDSSSFFNLRVESLEMLNYIESSNERGFIGARISPLFHQMYLTHKISRDLNPRVFLADEVGLGKTIEASLILHYFLTQGLKKRALIIVPDSLSYQWFFELHRKFNLGFQLINQNTPIEEGINPFSYYDRVITSQKFLKGAALARELINKSNFDILVVDEIHHWNLSDDAKEPEDQLLKNLVRKIPSTIFLSATPEQGGIHAHFDRLKALDPDKYTDFGQYKKEVNQLTRVSELCRLIHSRTSTIEVSSFEDILNPSEMEYLSKEKVDLKKDEHLIDQIVDCYGTGRAFYRNTRRRMEKHFNFFPKRILKSYPLENTSKLSDSKKIQKKTHWLFDLVKELNGEKVLLITHSKQDVEKLEKEFKAHTNIKTAVFHSELSLMARDRQAAYFADPDGAQILLCTEIGSEGRNFEFARHLVLFDLPSKPHLLEQRIGRLDRIGQRADILIHLPFFKESSEEALFKIYHEGLNSFEVFSPVAPHVFLHFREEILKILEATGNSLTQVFLKEVKAYASELSEVQEEGMEYLIERNSYRDEIAKEIVKNVKTIDDDTKLEQFLSKVFETLGVQIEELNRYATYIKPSDNMFIPYFPTLKDEGKTITYNRREALERDDYDFVTIDHPMVSESINLILSDHLGNLNVVTRLDGANKKSLFESYFVLSHSAPSYENLSSFFPTTVIRTLVDKDGVDYSEKWSKELIDSKTREAQGPELLRASKISKEIFKDLVSKSQEVARKKAEQYVEESKARLKKYHEAERERLLELQSRSELRVFEEKLNDLEDKKIRSLEHMENYLLRVDCIRVIF